MFIYVNIGQGYFEVAPVFLWYTQPHKKECERGRKNREWLPVNRPALKAPPHHAMFSILTSGAVKENTGMGQGETYNKSPAKRLQAIPRPTLPQGQAGDRAGEVTHVCPVSNWELLGQEGIRAVQLICPFGECLLRAGGMPASSSKPRDTAWTEKTKGKQNTK